MKNCPNCKQDKPIEEFYHRVARCKLCEQSLRREQRKLPKKTPTKVIKASRMAHAYSAYKKQSKKHDVPSGEYIKVSQTKKFMSFYSKACRFAVPLKDVQRVSRFQYRAIIRKQERYLRKKAECCNIWYVL